MAIDGEDEAAKAAATDYLADPVPEPDVEPSAAERAHARRFSELVDKTLAGRTPAAMSADDRALLEVATVIRAASGNAVLPASQQKHAVEAALRQAVGGGGASSSVVPITRGRARRWAPWMAAATAALVAAAAVVALWLRGPARVVRVEARVPATWKSRPSDAVVGEIRRERDAAASAREASARIDTIFADRLDGFRERRLAGGTP
jgi:hypothetical protein